MSGPARAAPAQAALELPWFEGSAGLQPLDWLGNPLAIPRPLPCAARTSGVGAIVALLKQLQSLTGRASDEAMMSNRCEARVHFQPALCWGRVHATCKLQICGDLSRLLLMCHSGPQVQRRHGCARLRSQAAGHSEEGGRGGGGMLALASCACASSDACTSAFTGPYPPRVAWCAVLAPQAVLTTHTRAPRNQADTNAGRQRHHRAQEVLQASAGHNWRLADLDQLVVSCWLRVAGRVHASMPCGKPLGPLLGCVCPRRCWAS